MAKNNVPVAKTEGQPQGQVINELTLKNEELNQLQGIIDELPYKHGSKLIQFFSLIAQKRQVEKLQASENESKTNEK